MFSSTAVVPSELVSAPLAPTLPSLPPLPASEPAAEYGKAPKLFVCTVCGITIKGRRSNLQRHMVDVHSDAKKKECGLCGKRLKHAAFLQHAKQCQGIASPPTAAAPAAPAAAPSPTPTPDVPAPEPSSVLVSSTRRSQSSSRRELSTEAIDAASVDFLKWLGEASVPTEHMARKRATPAAITQTRQAVRQLVRDAADALPDLFASGVHLRLLVVPDVVTALFRAMEERRVQASTVYPVALLLKKICAFLCRRMSLTTKAYIAPETLPGWAILCDRCYSTKERKSSHLARRLRGKGEDKWMRSDEKNRLLSACLAKLHETQQKPPDSFGASWTDFTDHLIVALLLLGLAPRQQTFRALTTEMMRPPGSDSRTPDQYVIDGEHAKTKMTYYCAIHPVLTSSARFYLERVLGVGYAGPLFLQSYGKARQDFSLTTRKLTKQYVGRSITASKFRMTVATDLLGKPGVNGRALADIMGHTEAVQQSWYVGVRMAESVRVCQEGLLEGVEVPAGMMAGP